MNRIMFVVALIICSGSILKAQEVVYDENAEVRNVGNFSAVEVTGTISLYLSQASQSGVAVSAGEAKYNEKIKTEVQNGVLKISVDAGLWNGFSWSNRKIKAYVAVADLSRLDLSGASLINIRGSLKTNSLNLNLSGASEIKGDIAVKNIQAGLSGASVMTLTGTAENASINASGAARANAFELKVSNGKLEASGASHITLTVSKSLSANASGGSSIHYKGYAVAKVVNSSGGASIKKKF